jgi:BirA family biotin operon repressor/biotin-[acetyl-CoA-carboxylase] ligase
MRAKDAVEVEIIRVLKGGSGGGAGGSGGGEVAGGFVSGQSLSRSLGISRAAVWKHIEGLRKAGYSIEARPRKGYRLDPAKNPYNGVEISSALKTDLIGNRIYFYDKVESTNVTAFELGRSGEPEGAAVVADSQSGGKGRIGRRWLSPHGVNLYTSVILRPGIMPRDAQMLTFLSAVAVAATVERFIEKKPVVKWPNDVLVNGKKIAGILMEMDAESDRVNFIVAGIGVNINSASVMELTGGEVSRVEFIRALFSNLEKWYREAISEGFSGVVDAWKGYFASEGKTIRVLSFGRDVEGVCLGIDKDGALLVKLRSGGIERVLSGDVQTTG